LPAGGLEGSVIQKHPWLLKIVRNTLALFSNREAKTPLAFFDRLNTKMVALATLGVFLVQPQERLELLCGAGALILLISIITAAITWYRPQNLVFGDSSYRRLSANLSTPKPPAMDSRNRPAA